MTNFSRILHHTNTGCLQTFHLFGSCALPTRNDSTGMAHAPSWWCCDPGDETDDRLLDIFLYELGCLLLRIATDLADHHDCLGLGILLEQRQHIDEACAINWIAADADAGCFTQPKRRELMHGFIGESSAA